MTQLTEKQQHWTDLINAWEQSGLSQADFCRQHNIDLKRFYTWKHQLTAKKTSTVQEGKFLAVTPADQEQGKLCISLFVQDIEVHYRPDTDDALLVQCLSLLRSL